ncbi:MAG: GTPase ObgE [Fusobacteria bacterium]|nr:GTPase ObgE [Fusobacteriota bacterium]
MFIDEAIIELRSGKGGDGAATFRREKSVQFGGPDGGDGGKGGSIVFEADPNMNTLINFKHQHNFFALDGDNGFKKLSTGKSADDLVIKVPVGTMVRDAQDGTLYLDMSEPYSQRELLRGGDGGRGNNHFRSSIHQTPKYSEKGFPGKELKVKLELKLLGDVALVGFPSVGKSTFINKVSAAKAKVAAYHFTTIVPNLGVVRVDDKHSFVIADIPGLVEGAHEGKGLGIKFLRHIERCRVIYHLLDAACFDGRDPIEDYQVIQKELKEYSPKLASKPQIVVANKIDAIYDKTILDTIKEYVEKEGHLFYALSAATGEGIPPLLYKTQEFLNEIQVEPLEDEIEPLTEQERVFDSMPEWDITQDSEGTWVIKGRIVEKLLLRFLFNHEDSVLNFIHILRNKGLEKELRKRGVEEGDTVQIAGREFEFME